MKAEVVGKKLYGLTGHRGVSGRKTVDFQDRGSAEVVVFTAAR